MSADKFARVLAVLAVLAVAVVAGIVSFSHIETLALSHGYTIGTARLLPVSVDGLIVASSMALLTGARAQREAPRLAQAGLVLGILATLAANVEAGAQFGAVGAVVNAWPAIAFIVASEILLGMLRATSDVPREVEAAVTVAFPLLADVPEGVPVAAPLNAPLDGLGDGARPVPAQRARTVAPARAPGRAPVAKGRTPERVFAADIERGELPSIRSIKARARCGTPRATEIRAQLAQLLQDAQPAAA